jgi:hypothetical protein
VAEALRTPVETWNVIILGDRSLRELDRQRLGPREVAAIQNRLATATPLLQRAADNRQITTELAGNAIRFSLIAANTNNNNLHTRQARRLAEGTSENLVVQILRGAHRVAQDLQDTESDEAKSFIKEYKSGIYKKLGELTIAGTTASVVGVGTALYFYGVPFLEFVVDNNIALKAFVGDAFQNPQLTQIIESIITLKSDIFD